MTVLTSATGGVNINGRFYQAGLLEMRAFGQSEDYALITYAVDGYVFSGIKRFDEFTIDGSVPADRTELLSWATAHFSTCGTPLPQLGPGAGLSGTVADGHSVLTWDAVTNATNYLLKKNGATIYSSALLTFDALGLTNGVAYTFTVTPQATGYQSGAPATTSVTPAATVVTNNVEWLSVETDPYPGLLTADAFSYTGSNSGSAAIASTIANEVLHVGATHPDNWFLITRRPVANVAKSLYDESGTSNINTPVPGAQFPRVFVARGYRYVVSNDSGVTFNPDPAATLTFHN